MKPDQKISLVISTTRGTDRFDFLGTTKVEEVIHEVREPLRTGRRRAVRAGQEGLRVSR